MRRPLTWGALFAFALLLLPTPGRSQSFVEETSSAPNLPVAVPVRYDRGVVVQVLGEGVAGAAEAPEPYQDVLIKLTSGPEAGREMQLDYRDFSANAPEQKLAAGDRVVVTRSVAGDLVQYYIADRYRLPSLGWLLVAFLVLGVAVGRRRGATAILGLAASIAAIAWIIVPALAAGRSPVLVGLAGAVGIAAVALYLAHGFSRQTTVALAGTVITLSLAAGAANLSVGAAHLLGLGNETAYFLQFTEFSGINLRGLLLAGILIGTLGVLDDITTAQAAVVAELRHANPSLSRGELYRRALRVGHEHVASLVNTLALAYAGASLPLFLFLISGSSGAPLWVTVNSEMIAEEVVRTLVGSAALILAVPITTALAVRFLRHGDPHRSHSHSH